MNASMTLETISIHAHPKMSHTVFNPMVNLTQDIAATMRLHKLSASQLLRKTRRTEISLLLALRITKRTNVPSTNYASGLERRLNVTMNQDGLPSEEESHALSSLIDTARTVISRSNSSSLPHLNSTTQLKTAALVVRELLRSNNFQLFQLIQRLSTTNVLTNQRMMETGESLSTANLSETIS